jgi:hypothetical protein
LNNGNITIAIPTTRATSQSETPFNTFGKNAKQTSMPGMSGTSSCARREARKSQNEVWSIDRVIIQLKDCFRSTGKVVYFH